MIKEELDDGFNIEDKDEKTEKVRSMITHNRAAALSVAVIFASSLTFSGCSNNDDQYYYRRGRTGSGYHYIGGGGIFRSGGSSKKTWSTPSTHSTYSGSHGGHVGS